MKPVFSYDKEADVLYISFFPGEKATAAVELNDNILLRFNRDERRAVGLTLTDFSVLIQLNRLGPVNFPLSGLHQIEPEWQNAVAEMITTDPVNRILKVSVYMPSLSESVPIAYLEKPSAAFAGRDIQYSMLNVQ